MLTIFRRRKWLTAPSAADGAAVDASGGTVPADDDDRRPRADMDPDVCDGDLQGGHHTPESPEPQTHSRRVVALAAEGVPPPNQ